MYVGQAPNGLILIPGPVSAAADDAMVGGKLGGMSNEDELACFACEGLDDDDDNDDSGCVIANILYTKVRSGCP